MPMRDAMPNANVDDFAMRGDIDLLAVGQSLDPELLSQNGRSRQTS